MGYRVVIAEEFQRLVRRLPKSVSARIRFQLAQAAELADDGGENPNASRAGSIDQLAMFTLPGGYWAIYELDDQKKTVTLTAVAQLSSRLARMLRGKVPTDGRRAARRQHPAAYGRRRPKLWRRR